MIMKKLLLFCAGILLILQAQAQLPNPGFEIKNGQGMAANWGPTSMVVIPVDSTCTWTLDSSLFLSNDAHSGNYALEMSVRSYCNNIYAPNVKTMRYDIDTFADQRILISERPASLNFYYKLFSQEGDGLMVEITLWAEDGSTVANMTMSIHQTIPQWTRAFVPVIYTRNAQPVFMTIKFQFDNSRELHDGSRVLIDDISIDNATGIGTQANHKTLTCYPVPANEQLFIETGLQTDADIIITDAIGKRVQQQTITTRTNGTTAVDIHELPRGIYFVTLLAPGEISTGKFMK